MQKFVMITGVISLQAKSYWNTYGDRMRVKTHVFVMCDPNPHGNRCPRVIFSNKGTKVRDDYKGNILAGKKILKSIKLL
jgi:hypothetical protein